ncbi:MAG: hypothetical protein A3J87_02795 [Sideroxydans sp. RIFOXYB12_FULL_59_6]|nr:MAG: hypothetical protein A3J87_02795 [Sideroxydans sp. RIFOXYB12_FULL_59_6]
MAMSALPIATGWRWGGYLCVSAASAWLLARDALMLAGRSCISFSCGKDRHIALVLRNGGKISGELCADTLVSPWLVLLNMAADHHGRQSLVLFPDAMTGEDFRRLRVLLRNSR